MTRATLHVDPSLERWTQARLAFASGDGVLPIYSGCKMRIEQVPDPLSALRTPKTLSAHSS